MCIICKELVINLRTSLNLLIVAAYTNLVFCFLYRSEKQAEKDAKFEKIKLDHIKSIFFERTLVYFNFC